MSGQSGNKPVGASDLRSKIEESVARCTERAKAAHTGGAGGAGGGAAGRPVSGSAMDFLNLAIQYGPQVVALVQEVIADLQARGDLTGPAA